MIKRADRESRLAFLGLPSLVPHPDMSLIFLIYAALIVLILHSVFRRMQYVSQVNQMPGFVKSSGLGLGMHSMFAFLRFAVSNKITNMTEMCYRLCLATPLLSSDGIFMGWFGPVPFLILSSPEAVASVLTNNELTKKGFHYSFLQSWLGNGLLTSYSTKWQNRRKLLTPAFHLKILNKFITVMEKCGNILIVRLQREAENNEGVIEDLSSRMLSCTLDVICETAMGEVIDAQSNPDSSYVKAVKRLGDLFIERSVNALTCIEFIFKWTSIGREYYRLLRQVHSFTDRVIAERKKKMHTAKNEPNNKDADSGIDSGDKSPNSKVTEPFMDTLIREQIRHPDEVTDTSIREEVDTFMFEGHDTTGWAVTWATYLLGSHHQHQERLQQELDDVFGHKDSQDMDCDLHHNKLKHKVPFLDAVVKETMRLFPSVPLITRVTEKEEMIGSYKVPAGVQIVINITGTHRDPKYWPDPHRFDPDRFMGKDVKQHPFAFIPFSAGARNCIGQKMAFLEQKSIIAKVFQKFRVESLDPLDTILPNATLTTKAEHKLRVKLQLRE